MKNTPDVTFGAAFLDSGYSDKYIFDTTNVAEKIRGLISLANKEKTAKNLTGAIKNYLRALTLEDYVKDSLQLRVFLHSEFSGILFDTRAYYPAFSHAKEAYALIKAISPEPSVKSYHLLGKIGSYYMSAGIYDSAYAYYNKSIVEAQGIQQPLWVSASLNNMGILYMKTGQLDSAAYLFSEALNILQADQTGNQFFKLSIKDNIADNLLAAKEHDKALAIYTENLAQYKALQKPEKVAPTLVDMAEASLALAYTLKARQYLNEAKINAQHLDIKDYLRLGSLWRKYYEATGNVQMAFAMQDWVQHISDSIAIEDRHFLSQLTQELTYSQLDKFKKDIHIQQLNLGKLGREKQVALGKAKQNLLWLIMAALIGITLALVLYLIFRHRSKMQHNSIKMHMYEKQLAEANLKNEALEKEKLEKELSHKKEDLTDLSIYLSKLKNTNEDLLDKLNRIVAEQDDNSKTRIQQIAKDLRSKLHADKKYDALRENTEIVNKEFYDKLKKNHPSLTKSEVELCGFLRLNMSSKDIGALRNISTQSVKMARYRLRKKFGLNHQEDISRFLANL